MRVISTYIDETIVPEGDFKYGETEDYTFYADAHDSQSLPCSGGITLHDWHNTLGNYFDIDGYNYYNDQTCSWLIKPEGGTNIDLTFLNFSTEANNDFVTVYDGENTSGKLLGKFSGATLPSKITATSGNMYVVFTSNSNNIDKGFFAKYNCYNILQSNCSTNMNPPCNNSEYIGHVQIYSTTLNSITTCVGKTGNYSSFPASGNTTATLTVNGNYYSFGVSAPVARLNIATWIDFNNNNVFETTEFYDFYGVTGPNILNFISIKVPTNATKGLIKMRLRSRNEKFPILNSDACTIFESGETEDYYLTITYSPAQAPVANFSASSTNIQIGGSVNYTDNSTNTPTSWEWTFTGGNPNTSNSQNPSNIVYSAEGCYDVKLIVANSFGRDTILKTCYINVSSTSTSCNELFFSEYLEGASNNKAIEIYNPSGTAVNLSSYSIQLYANGSTTPTNTIVLSGSIASRDVYVLANSGAIASILSSSDITSAVCSFNGDDALVLKKGSNVIDVIGVVGTDPGTFWSVGTGSTLDYTLVRNSTVDAPSTSWATVQNQWTVYPVNTTTYLGQHTSTCSPITAIVDDPLQNNIHIYPNPTDGVTTISLSTDVADIEITDLLGNQLIKNQTVQKATNIDLDENGVYIVRITTKQGTLTRKLIVRH